MGKKKELQSGRCRRGEPLARTEREKNEVLYRGKRKLGAGLVGKNSDVTLEFFLQDSPMT